MLLRNGVAVFLLLKAFDVQRHRAAAEPDVEIERAGFGRGAGAGHEHCCAEQRRRGRRNPRPDRLVMTRLMFRRGRASRRLNGP